MSLLTRPLIDLPAAPTGRGSRLTNADRVTLAEFLAARAAFIARRPDPHACARFLAAERHAAALIHSGGAVELPALRLTLRWCPEAGRFRVLAEPRTRVGGLAHAG